MTKIFIASDHAGFDLKAGIIASPIFRNDIEDLGASSTMTVDYPNYSELVCNAVLSTPGSVGVLICSTGIGMSIAANRYKGIRAALCRTANDVKLARKHNDANILVLGASITSDVEALSFLELFLKTSFDGGRHVRRLELIDNGGGKTC